MRPFARLALVLIPFAGMAQAQAPATPPPAREAAAPEDPQLRSLIRETLDRNPGLAEARALVDANQERIPQAKALPDPSLTLGLQNDGFKGIQVGKMETSYYQVMVTQPLPWPGKRGLRGDLAGLDADASRTTTDRTRLTLVADLKRAYYGLLLVRGQQELLEQQAGFWQKASDLTRVRYEVGQGSQADLLRAQLEQHRLRQTALALKAQEAALQAALNRLRGAPRDAPILTTVSLADLAPHADPAAQWLARAEQESPELRAAHIGIQQAERSLDLARRNRYPDFAVSAGLMPRGGLDPMWQVGVSISLPIWSRQKQQRAVHEQEFRRRAQGSETENVRSVLAQRIQERAAQFEAAVETLHLYKDGLLIQSEASFQASLAQYEAGRAPFLGVLEALNGWVADRGGYLQAMAQALSLQVAQEEFNLAGAPPISAQGLNAPSMGMGGSPAAGASSSAKAGAASGSEAGPGMKSM